MQSRKIKRLSYTVRHRYLTMNNVVLAIAAVITVSWAWSSVQAVQRNYQLQREIDNKKRQEKLTELQAENLQFEQNYYKSNEYLTLEAKRRLGLAEPGEKVLVLPPNSAKAQAEDRTEDMSADATPADTPPPAPMTQWLDFLFGIKPPQ